MKNANRPFAVIKNLVPTITKQLSNRLINREIFNRVIPHYNDALARSRFTKKLTDVDKPQAFLPHPQKIRRKKLYVV